MNTPETGTSPRRNSPTPKAVKASLLQVRNLIERLRAASSAPEGGKPDGFGVVAFFTKSLGGLRLAGENASRYRECLESLIALHGNNPDLRALSRQAAEGLLKTTMLRAIRPRFPPIEERTTFERRLDRELRKLHAELTAPPGQWHVTVQVHGFASNGLPFRFGDVEFAAGNAETAAAVASQLRDFEPKRGVNKERLEAEQRVRVEERKKLCERFSAATIARIVVRAIDDEAARHLGIERVRRALDILNFFAPYFHNRPDAPRAFVAPDGKRTSLSWTVRPVLGDSFHWSCPSVEFARRENGPIQMIELNSPRSVEIGLARTSAMLEAASPTDLEARIINALTWAGRGCTEPRRDVAFLLFTISLEALLTKPSARSGVTDRLRLRVAHLIGLLPEARKHAFDLMGRIYTVRSNLVHTGDTTDLTDADLDAARELVQLAITVALTDRRFSQFRRAADLERWLDDQLVIGASPPSVQQGLAD